MQKKVKLKKVLIYKNYSDLKDLFNKKKFHLKDNIKIVVPEYDFDRYIENRQNPNYYIQKNDNGSNKVSVWNF